MFCRYLTRCLALLSVTAVLTSGAFPADREVRYLTFAAKNEKDIYLRQLQKEEVSLKIDGQPVDIGYMGFHDVDTAFVILLENSPRTARWPVSRPRLGQVNPIDNVRYQMMYDFFGPLTQLGPVALGEFFMELEMLQDFTTYEDLLLNALNNIHPNIAGVNVDNLEVGRALGRGVDMLNARPEKRKVLLFFTTHIDRQSYGNLEEYQLMLRNTDIDLVVISYALRFASGPGVSFEEKMNRYFFKNLAEETAGWAYITGEYAYMDTLFTDLRSRLQNSYTIGFYVERDGPKEEHEVEIELSCPKCKVTHRKYLVY